VISGTTAYSSNICELIHYIDIYQNNGNNIKQHVVCDRLSSVTDRYDAQHCNERDRCGAQFSIVLCLKDIANIGGTFVYTRDTHEKTCTS